MAMKNRTENSAPSTRSMMKAFLIIDLDLPSILGRGGGSMKSRVPDKKTVALKARMSVIINHLIYNYNILFLIRKSIDFF
jgi:hypothetical protein